MKLETGSKELIRKMNRKLVLENIIHNGPVSRAATAKKLGLTRATVSAIVQELIEDAYVEEIGSQDTSLGRKPILLRFCGQNGHVLSLNLKVDEIILMACDLEGNEILHLSHRETLTRQNVLSLLDSLILQTIESLPPTPFRVVGITLGIHGTVQDQEILFAPNYPLAGLPLASALNSRLGIPVWLENEANLSALADNAFSAAGPNLIHINIHTGVGAGIIVNRRLYRGKDGNAGELGHTVVVPEGRPCPCGSRGCLEQYIADPAILAEFSRRSGLPSPSMEDLAAAWEHRDLAAVNTVDDFVRYLAVGINNLGNLFSPDCIIISSALLSCLPQLLPMIRSCLPPRLRNTFALSISECGDRSILMGGASLAISRFLKIQEQPAPAGDNGSSTL